MGKEIFRHERKFIINPNEVLVIGFPHLDDLVIIDGRPDQSSKRAFLASQEEIVKHARNDIADDFQNILRQTTNIRDAITSLPEQVEGIAIERISTALVEKFNLQPTANSEGIGALPITFTQNGGAVAQFWGGHQQSFFEKFAGQIDLIVDIRKCFEELIAKEKQRHINQLHDYYPLWQNPDLQG